MLERYCRALGVDVFNADLYGPDCIVLESSVVTGVGAHRPLSLAEAQA